MKSRHLGLLAFGSALCVVFGAAALAEDPAPAADPARGEKLFDLEDKAILSRQSAGTIATVFGSIFETVSVEDQEKN